MTPPPGAAPALATALWLGALWYVAPLLGPKDGERRWPASRLRDAIAIGTAIPLGLAMLGLLTPVACVAALAAAAVARAIVRPPRRAPTRAAAPLRERLSNAVPIAAVVATAWPGLVRPIMQGDSLGYHLPNVASFAVTHGAYATITNEWWYPCGSEMFAAGIFAIGGPLEVGLAGTVASLLLALRLTAFCREASLGPLESGTFAAAVVTVPLVALQGSSLENDVWLAAWLLEVLWASRHEPAASARSIAVTALLKPNGWLFAAIAALAGRAGPRALLTGAIVPALWALRTALLWRGAVIDPHRLAGPIVPTTIVAHGWLGLATLARAVVQQGPGMTLLAAALVACIAFARDAPFRLVALATALFFLVEPFGFANAHPQLATGASLRYLFPALVVGAAGIAPLLRFRARGPNLVVSGALALLAVWQISVTRSIFANDANTRDAVPIAMLTLAAAFVPASRLRSLAPRVPAGPAFLALSLGLGLAARAGTLAASHPLDYYDAAIAAPGAPPSRLYDALAASKPRAAVGYGLRVGSIVAATPSTEVADPLGDDSCDEARRLRAVLVVAYEPEPGSPGLAERLAYGRRCGNARYADASTLVIVPFAAR